MTEPAAFEAEVYSLRTAPTQGVVAVTLHCPIEWLQKVVEIVGGKGARVAVVRLQEPPAKQPEAKNKRPWNTLTPTEQSAIRCTEQSFEQFLNEVHNLGLTDTWTTADFVRHWCGVKSRAELTSNVEAAERWNKIDRQFCDWLNEPRYTG